MNYQEMINMKVKCISEQIQEDLLTLFDYDNVKEEVKNEACKVVSDRFAELMTLLKADTQVRLSCNNSLTKVKSE